MKTKLSNPEVKRFIGDLIFYGNDVDEGGKPIRRTYFRRDYVKGWNEVNRRLQEKLELGYGPKEKEQKDMTLEEIVWVKREQVADNKTLDGLKLVLERHTAEEIEFSPRAVEAIRYYYHDREEVAGISEEALAIFEKLIGEEEKEATSG